MRQRGRKSSASLTVVGASSIDVIPRPEPPADLTAEQCEEWSTIVNRMPADHFPPETLPMLAAYVRHTTAARRVAQLIEQAEARPMVDVVEYDRLLKMQEREGRALSSLAMRMRLAQVSTVKHDRARKPAMVAKPWIDD
jgi:hypothetical protein